jgi:hypothetical protein
VADIAAAIAFVPASIAVTSALISLANAPIAVTSALISLANAPIAATSALISLANAPIAATSAMVCVIDALARQGARVARDRADLPHQRTALATRCSAPRMGAVAPPRCGPGHRTRPADSPQERGGNSLRLWPSPCTVRAFRDMDRTRGGSR